MNPLQQLSFGRSFTRPTKNPFTRPLENMPQFRFSGTGLMEQFEHKQQQVKDPTTLK